MRQTLKDQEVGLDPKFRYRGMSQTRIETFSDTAFALAITLLVLSSSVPETFQELKMSMRNVIPFGICITLIAVIWYQHYIFFIRYGLQNAVTVILNIFLLFLILVYVYPLKFLARFLVTYYSTLFNGDSSQLRSEFGELLGGDGVNMGFLMIVYGLGAFAIFGTLGAMYGHALKQRSGLNLNEYETFTTNVSMVVNFLQAGIAMLSVLVAAFKPFGAQISPIIAGFVYMLYPIVLPGAGWHFNKKRKKQFPEDT